LPAAVSISVCTDSNRARSRLLLRREPDCPDPGVAMGQLLASHAGHS